MALLLRPDVRLVTLNEYLPGPGLHAADGGARPDGCAHADQRARANRHSTFSDSHAAARLHWRGLRLHDGHVIAVR